MVGITPYFSDPDVDLYVGEADEVLAALPDRLCEACVTSPPYLDARPEYPSPTIDDFGFIFSELRRVVDGPVLLNVGRLWRDGSELLWWHELVECARSFWRLRDTLIWAKPNANPIQGEILTNAHEYVFLFGDGFDPDAVRTSYSPESIARYRRRFAANSGVKGQPRGERRTPRVGSENDLGARAKSYVEFTTGREKANPHPAPMPLEVALHLVLLSGGASIIDPFAGSGTTLAAARHFGRKAVGIERSPEYCAMAAERLGQQVLPVV